MEIRDRLRKAMNDNGINARELSRRCGISESSISRYLLGQMEPKTVAIAKMADVLHVDPVWLAGLDKPELEIKPDFSVETGKIAMLIEYMTPSEKSQVESFVKFLIENRGGTKDD